MKRLILLCSMLVVCAAVQGDPGVALTLGADGLRITAGSTDFTDTLVYVFGAKLRYNNKGCENLTVALKCNLGTIPAGKTYFLSVTGAHKAEVYGKVNGELYSLTALQSAVE